jgi:hypothetical protein
MAKTLENYLVVSDYHIPFSQAQETFRLLDLFVRRAIHGTDLNQRLLIPSAKFVGGKPCLENGRVSLRHLR